MRKGNGRSLYRKLHGKTDGCQWLPAAAVATAATMQLRTNMNTYNHNFCSPFFQFMGLQFGEQQVYFCDIVNVKSATACLEQYAFTIAFVCNSVPPSAMLSRLPFVCCVFLFSFHFPVIYHLLVDDGSNELKIALRMAKGSPATGRFPRGRA